MLRMRFTKMHGCGNDYVYLDAFEERMPEDLPALARAMSDRHTGIGADGLIVLAPDDTAAARMLMFNADGSRGAMCGNGLRCLAKLAWDHGRVDEQVFSIASDAGPRQVQLRLDADDRCIGARVDMDPPIFDPAAIPVRAAAGRPPRLHLHDALGAARELLCIGMGNPHAVMLVEDADDLDLARIGPTLEHDDHFPDRCNISAVSLRPAEADGMVLRQRTWERGSGETQACGSGACATVVAAICAGWIGARSATVDLNGGRLHIAWPDDDAGVIMTGPAETVFTGEWG